MGYTTGVFDMFHIGHLNLLERAKDACDYLIVGVTTDELCFSRKKKMPIISYSERTRIIKSIRFVDKAVPQDSMDKMSAWHEHRFNRIFVGDDWKGTPAWQEYEAEFAKVGVEIVYFPYTAGTSSTELRKALESLNGVA